MTSIFLIFFSKNKEHFDNNNIEKIIIQTWKDKNIPEKYKKDIESLKKFNPSYKYIFFTDEEIEKFLKENYPRYYDVYMKLPVKIQKIDFFRYVAVYHFGGFYFDLDITCLKSLDDLLKYRCVFPIDQKITERMCSRPRMKEFCERDMRFLLGQYAFGARKNSEFLRKLVDKISDNVDKYVEESKEYRDKGQMFKRYIYRTTGPDFVTKMYMVDKGEVKILESDEDQFFGDYAVHNHFGTWK